MAKHKPIAEHEMDAARQYIHQTVLIRMRFGPGDKVEQLPDLQPCCPAGKETTFKHQLSLRHIAYRENITLARLRHVVVVVKVMEALDDAPQDMGKWKRA